MQMRSFAAKDMQDAMAQARDEMGDDAVILSTDKHSDGGVVVTFALDRADDEPFFDQDDRPGGTFFSEAMEDDEPLTPVNAEPVIHRVEDALRYHGTPTAILKQLLDTAETLHLPDEHSLEATEQALTDIFNKSFRFDPLPIDRAGTRLMLVGPPGMGKTITTAKLAAKMVVDDGNVMVISTDSNRAGGAEQLDAFTKILGVRFEIADNRDHLRDLLRDTDKNTRVMIDSAGCNPYDFAELKELGEFASLSDIEPILVCAAGIDAGEAQEIASVFSFLDIERILISRTDCARRFGSMLSAAHAGDYAFSHVTSSSKIMGELRALDALGLAHLLTHYQRERTAA